METTAPKTDDNDQNQLKKWLMARTVGLPTAWNRLLNFHFVRSTKAVVYTPHMFVQDAGSGFASLRTTEHMEQHPGYPDPVYYLSFLGKYFYRNPALRHLRVEQFRAFIGIHKPEMCLGLFSRLSREWVGGAMRLVQPILRADGHQFGVGQADFGEHN